MHLGTWRRLVSKRCWTSDWMPVDQDKWTGVPFGKHKQKQMSSENSGRKGGQEPGIHPRMRLDFPPGGFLRPDGSPAAASSARGASAWWSGPASGSAALFSVSQTEFSPSVVVGASAEWLVLWFIPLLRGADDSPHSTPVGFPPGGLFLRLA